MENNNLQAKSEYRIKISQLLAYGAGGIIPIALFNIAGILVGLMGNISLGLSAFWLGTILIIPRLWDAIADPIIGHLSDNTRTRWGRRRPFLLVGGILVALFFVAMWWIPKGETIRIWFPSESGYQWFQLSYILVTLLLFYTSCAIFEIPHGALGMEMTVDPHERTRLFSAKSFVGNLFAMSTPWLFVLANLETFKGPGGNEADGMRYVSLMIAALLIPLSFWWTAKLREPSFVRVQKQEKKPFWTDMKHTTKNRNFIRLTLAIFTLATGFNFVTLLGSYIPIFYVFSGDKVAGAYLLGINGTIWAVTGLLAVFPLNWISPKLGKRNTLILSIALMATAQLSKIVCYNPEYPYLIIIPTILLSAGMLFFFTLGSSMVGDICDEDDLNTGHRKEGSFYSVFWWFIKMGFAVASFVAGILIEFTQFDQNQVTKVDYLEGSIKEIKVNLTDKNVLNYTDYIKKIKDINTDILGNAIKYDAFLERVNQHENPQTDSLKIQAKVALRQNLSITIDSLKYWDSVLNTSSPDSVNLSIIAQKLNKQRMNFNLIKAQNNVYDLMNHFESIIAGKGDGNHYKELLRDIAQINCVLQEYNIYDIDSVNIHKLDEITQKIPSLKRQSPFTLLMMRVVEIGLPVIMSILSLIFIFRYNLTEKRLQEIKQTLTTRNKLQNQ
ncbi:MAG: MFS transporter [Tenuifilum sp.]|uniref:MFS transporter n=1 Tax=Tenuifilum sp. TaxID=2760880 RepID=UPI001B69C15B|nr:MFS transporter [Bacteroidales bacterium]HOK60123.1 MFS transporter [Tenuifilum sp.]MBP9029615.1 MFS transporter [Bacteroidales bacterium]HOK84957.1 MFS transporter [Tenuifilum sp.]HON69514.1 MFS transporter [Tenuifilum sp.]